MSAQIGTDLQHARKLLENGELVAIPTETVYGLAGNATASDVVARIFEVKARPQFDPLIVHIGLNHRPEEYATALPNWAGLLAEAYWPGPLTLVLPKRDNIPDIVTAGLPSVALRMPLHPLTQELLSLLPFPLAAPSANPFGYVSPTSATHVQDQLGDKIAYIIDGGECGIGIESTIVGEIEGRPRVLRLGGLTIEAINEVIGPIELYRHAAGENMPMIAAGMAKSHYAPRKEVILGEPESPDEATGALRFQTKLEGIPEGNQLVLSAKGDLREAAIHLFAALRTLDTLPISKIYAELVPDVGLGRAINDRLKRASVIR